jgi:hypothetical protein
MKRSDVNYSDNYHEEGAGEGDLLSVTGEAGSSKTNSERDVCGSC